MSHKFEIVKHCPQSQARAGMLTTPHGVVPTPVFLPVGSQGTVKTLTPEELKTIGVTMVLGNAYHLLLRPGIEVIERLGGLHRFMAWDGPILTDSGGYQIFSLAPLRQVSAEGILFRSHIDGSEHFLTPEIAIQFQERLGADIALVLDECPPYGEDMQVIQQSMERTNRWAERCRMVHQRDDQAIYGIVQGGIFPELRRLSAAFLSSLEFQGYAIGGLSLGEPKEVMLAIVEETSNHLPDDKPRHLMGVGSPEDVVKCVSRGVDIFDSALPTRIARNGALFTPSGRRNIRNACFRDWQEPIDTGCDCYACRNFSAAYLHHLFKCEEMLAYRLATIHNLRFIIRLTEQIRQAILDNTFPAFRDSFLSHYQPTLEEERVIQKQRWLQSRLNPPPHQP